MNFTEDELKVLFTALEFVEDKYLNLYFQSVRKELLKKIGEKI